MPKSETSRMRQRTFNVLLVVSRPNKHNDIDPLLGSRCIVDALRSLPPDESAKVVVDVARPGTFKALEAHLERTTKDWKQRGGVGAWFDMVVFDVHGQIENDTAYLSFLSSSGLKEHRVSATKIAALLREYEVEVAFLVSCESAKVTGSPSSNLARTFVEAGMSAVVAMSFKFTASASKSFLMSFFIQYLGNVQAGVTEALVTARSRLVRSPERNGKFGLKVVLPDYLVPVVYINSTRETSRNVPFADFIHQGRRLLQASAIQDFDETVGDLVGREQDVLEIEARVLKASSTRPNNILLLRGVAGVGKTALLTFLRWWWPYTEFCMACTYVDLGALTGIDELRAITAVWSSDFMLQVASEQRNVFIIDNLDRVSYSSPSTNPAEAARASQCLKGLKQWLARMRGSKVVIILASKSRESWLAEEGVRSLDLQGLSPYDSAELMAAILDRMKVKEKFADAESTKYLAHLASHLGHNPLAIKEYVPVLQRQSEMDRDSVRVWVDNPFKLYNHLQNGSTRPHQDRSSLRFTQELLQFCDKNNPAMKRVLLGLAPMWNVYREDWFDTLIEWMPQYGQSIPPLTEIRTFFDSYILDSGWADIVRLPKGSLQQEFRYIRLHPLFCLALRGFSSYLDIESGEDWSDRTSKIFLVHFCLRGAQFYTSTAARIDIKPQMLLESSNFLRAVELQTANLDQVGNVLGHTLVVKSIGYILYRLWELVRSSGVPHLNVDILIDTSDGFLQKLLDSPPAGLNQYGTEMCISFLTVGTCLVDHLMVRDIGKAIQYAESCVTFLEPAPDPWGTNEVLVFKAQVMMLKASALSGQAEGTNEAEAACQFAAKAVEILAELGSKQVKFADVKKATNMLAYSTLRNLSAFSSTFREKKGIYDQEYDQLWGGFTSRGWEARDSKEYGPVLAAQEQLTRRNWWQSELGVRKTDTYRALMTGDDTSSDAGDTGENKSKADLLLELHQAVSSGDETAEYFLQNALVRYHEKEEDWKTAAEHVREILRLDAALVSGDRHTRDMGYFQGERYKLRHALILIRADAFKEAYELYGSIITEVLNKCASAEEGKQKTHFLPGMTWATLMKEGSSWDVILPAMLETMIAQEIGKRWPGATGRNDDAKEGLI